MFSVWQKSQSTTAWNPYPPPPTLGNKNGKNNGRIANSPFEDPKVKLLEEQNALLQNTFKQHNIQLPSTQKNSTEEEATNAQEEIQRLLQKGIPENEIPPSLVKIANSQTQPQNENKNQQTMDELQLERKLNYARKQLHKKTLDYNKKVAWLAEAKLHGLQAQAEVDELEKQYEKCLLSKGYTKSGSVEVPEKPEMDELQQKNVG